MLVCPIYANEGLPQVPSGYFESAAELVRREGGLLIADEVQSGFGRTGHWWGYQQYAVVPDIITLGKPMGAGHPLAGLVTRREVMDPFRAREMYFNTFGGNPVSCAVGDAVLDVLEAESLVDNAAIQGQYITERLRHLINHHASVGDIRNNGLFVGVDIVSDRREQSPGIQTAAQIVNQMRHEGILISKAGALNNVLKIRPPLCFDRAQADQLCDTLASVMANI